MIASPLTGYADARGGSRVNVHNLRVDAGLALGDQRVAPAEVALVPG